MEGSRFNGKRFPAVVLRKTEPKCTILCFQSGKIIVIGEKYLKSPQEELMADLMQIINVFTAKHNGMRRYKKIEKIK